MRLTPEQLISELYGPPPKAGQKKLEDFRKKNIKKPERPQGSEDSIIRAQSPEGKELVFDFEQIKQHWIDFYERHNLSELAQSIKDAQISLAPEQIDQIIQKAKEGFDYFICLPSPELQKQYLSQIRDETQKPIPNLADEQQYNQTPDSSGQKGIWLSDAVKPNFPANLNILNRPQNTPYLLFVKDTAEVDPDTKGKTADQLRQEFEQRDELGFTLPEYLIFQRDYVQRHLNDPNPHPDTSGWGWLLDAESPQTRGPVRVLGADWHSGIRRVEVVAHSSGAHGAHLGARPSAIFKIL